MNKGAQRRSSGTNTLQWRRRIGGRFAMLILAMYFGFALLIAFAPDFLALGAPFSVGFGLIVLHLAAIVVLNAIYMTMARELKSPGEASAKSGAPQ